MVRKPLKFDFAYADTPERRCFTLERDGVPCLPVLGYDAYRKIVEASPFHVHAECLEISLCLRGDLAFEVEGAGLFPFKPGEVFVSRPTERHRLRAHPRNLAKYWILFRIPAEGTGMLRLPKEEGAWLRDSLLALPRTFRDDRGRVKSAFQRLFRVHDEAPAGTAERSLLLREASLALFVALVETARLRAKAPPDARLRRLIAEIESAPERDHSVDELAARAATSVTALLLGFKRLTGMPPHAFVLTCRVAKAKTMLSGGGASVVQIAQKLGFPSAQHFATIFKRLTGCTPTQWRAARTMDGKGAVAAGVSAGRSRGRGTR